MRQNGKDVRQILRSIAHLGFGAGVWGASSEIESAAFVKGFEEFEIVKEVNRAIEIEIGVHVAF